MQKEHTSDSCKIGEVIWFVMEPHMKLMKDLYNELAETKSKLDDYYNEHQEIRKLIEADEDESTFDEVARLKVILERDLLLGQAKMEKAYSTINELKAEIENLKAAQK